MQSKQVSNGAVTKTATQARQGEPQGFVRRVLAISLALTIVVLAAIYVLITR